MKKGYGSALIISSQLRGEARAITFEDRYVKLVDSAGRLLKDKLGRVLFCLKTNK